LTQIKKLIQQYKLQRLLKSFIPKQARPPAFYTDVIIVNKILLKYWLTKNNLHAKYHVKSWLKSKNQDKYNTKIDWYLEGAGF
jgi:hypothetical protein